MKWNPIFNLVMEIKHNYVNRFNDDTINFELWLEKLDFEYYNDIFECLQVNQCEDLLLIRYGLAEMQKGMWQNEDSIYRECRSVVIDLKNEQLVMTPFKKFFNLDEVEENKLHIITEKIKNAKVVEYSNKLDGSMQCARYYNGKFLMTGSMALDRNDSWRLDDGYKMLKTNYKQMLIDNPNTTFIFEYISLKDAHVVLYDKSEEGLYLIGMRSVLDGKEGAYKEVVEVANKYDVKHIELENITLDEMLEQMKTFKSHQKEGWVMNIDGHKVKLKCDDYSQIHRMLDKLSSINVIIKNIADDTFDDLISKVPDNYRGRVYHVANKIFEFKVNKEKEIKEYYRQADKSDKKTFMIWVTNNVPKDCRSYVTNIYLKKDYNVLRIPRTNRIKKLCELGICENYSALFSDMEG